MDNKFETEVLTRLAVIEAKIDDYKQTERLANEAYQKSIQNTKDIQEIRENNKWLKRAVIGAVISALGSFCLIIVEKGLGIK